MVPLRPQQSRSRAKREFCPRCHVRIAADVRRCPKCGERISSAKRYPIYIGIIGVLALVFVAVMMLMTAQHEESADAPGVNMEDAPSPDTAPAKPPPLNK